MNICSASYNFPDNFLWGTVADEGFLQDKDSYAYIFKLKEHRFSAVLLTVPWAMCEPLKGNYDQVYIDSIRTVLARIRGQNIEPILFLDTGTVPAWQNLDRPDKTDAEEEYHYLVRISDALIPYANFVILTCPVNSFFSRKKFTARLAAVNNAITHIHSLSEKTKAGLSLPSSAKNRGKWGFPPRFDHLKTTDYDFLAITAGKESMEFAGNIFGSERRPVLFTSDSLKKTPPDERIVRLSEKLYDVWQFYQKGWPILGFCSETELNESLPEFTLYANSCQKNAFEISTQMTWLPEKWIQFLKD